MCIESTGLLSSHQGTPADLAEVSHAPMTSRRNPSLSASPRNVLALAKTTCVAPDMDRLDFLLFLVTAYTTHSSVQEERLVQIDVCLYSRHVYESPSESHVQYMLQLEWQKAYALPETSYLPRLANAIHLGLTFWIKESWTKRTFVLTCSYTQYVSLLRAFCTAVRYSTSDSQYKTMPR